MFCIIQPGQADTDQSFLAAADSPGFWQTIPLQATISLATPTTVSLVCEAESGSDNDVLAAYSKLNLLQVGSIH